MPYETKRALTTRPVFRRSLRLSDRESILEGNFVEVAVAVFRYSANTGRICFVWFGFRLVDFHIHLGPMISHRGSCRIPSRSQDVSDVETGTVDFVPYGGHVFS